MRTFTIALMAAAGLAIAAPAFADSVSVGVGGVGVGVHEHEGSSIRVREGSDRIVHREGRERVTVGMGERRHCKVVIVHRDGMTKKIKRCS